MRVYRRNFSCFFVTLALVSPLIAQEPAKVKSKTPDAFDVAKRVDAALLGALDRKTPLPKLADDATFLRRVFIDLTGKVPDEKDLTAFLADKDPGKRSKLIDQLLTSENHAINWGRYRRDVFPYH